MSDSIMPSHAPHAHLSPEALWTLAEDGLKAAQESPEALQAKACPLCGPSLRFAVTQLASLRALPALKAPPDFLAQVHARLEKEGLRGRKGWRASLADFFAPALGSRLPAGLASAALLVLILVWNFPYSPEQGPAEESRPPEVAPLFSEVKKTDDKGEASIPEAEAAKPAERSEKKSEVVAEKQKPVVKLAAPPRAARQELALENEMKSADAITEAPGASMGKASGAEIMAMAPPPSLVSRLSRLGLDWRLDPDLSGDSLRFFIPIAQGDKAARLVDSLGYGGLYRVLRQGDSLRFSFPQSSAGKKPE